MDELSACLALVRCNLPPTKLQDLLNHFTSADRVLSAGITELEQLGLNPDNIKRIKSPDLAGIDRDLAWQGNPGHAIILIGDTRYPQTLKSINQPPILLYAIGDTDYLNQPQFAMVGSRTPTAIGKRTAFDFARHLSGSGLTITSGLALGIDTECHRGALEGLAGTVAVVANGLNRIYPSSNTALAEQIAQNGCIITESPVGTEPHKGLFPRRNRIISGIAQGTLVVEAAKNSGSLITARHALEQDREVFAIPGSIHNPLARGCHSLIKQGAKLVETAEDILEELLPLVNFPSSSHTSAHIESSEIENSLDPDHQALLDSMEYEAASIDLLVERNPLNAAEIASMLLILELQGHVISENGLYSRIDSKH
ncbi:MAG: DNA-processing protein DprA [Gammaproteobacteria bacterium]|nr:DNA-processing protein DprA [Gammaproteobacteria bacterium]